MKHNKISWEKIGEIQLGDTIETTELGVLRVLNPKHSELGGKVSPPIWGRRLLVETKEGVQKLLQVAQGLTPDLLSLNWEQELKQSGWRNLWAA
ncbi:MAG: hypothetical protein WCW14_01720 [Candidatus Paceibacterota bacterium]|jgi:hypothetical protein